MEGLMVIHDDTIVALCSPKGPGAIGLIRISGPNAITIADAISLLSGKKNFHNQPTHTIQYGKVISLSGSSIDSVLFLLMRAPKTFTGQDTVEITCHNNPFIIEAIIARALSAGARLAQPGEFTKLAVINKKIDLIQAESINELIHANSQQAIKRSLAQLEGSLSQKMIAIEKQLLHAVALCEASFEFLDEENLEFGSQISSIIEQSLMQIAELEESFGKQKQIREGIRIAFIGSVNAGKSSLFNEVIGSKRSIVTNQAGTTRDVIEAGLYEDGFYWTLIDTAGLRQTKEIIEKEGIARSYQEAEKADIVILTVDGSREQSDQEIAIYSDLLKKYDQKSLLVYNKSDLHQKAQILAKPILLASINSKESINQIKKTLKDRVNRLLEGTPSPYLLSQRQHSLLLRLKQKIPSILPLLKSPIQYELVSHHLNETLSELSELTGKTISEAAMDAIFREFCIGK